MLDFGKVCLNFIVLRKRSNSIGIACISSRVVYLYQVKRRRLKRLFFLFQRERELRHGLIRSQPQCPTKFRGIYLKIIK